MADHSVTLNLVLPRLELDAALKYNGPRTTDTSNAFDGAECGGGAIVNYTPPVATGSAPLPVTMDVAYAFPKPDIDARGWPTTDDPDAISLLNPLELMQASHVDRIEVGGKDITWIFATDETDEPTQMPGFQLIEPFGYGSSQLLTIPRTNTMFEKYGTGRLRWLHQGASVRYSRVYNVGTEDQEVRVDYLGVVEAVMTDQVQFTVRVGGAVVSRMGSHYKPQVKRRRIFDIGFLMHLACQEFGFPLHPASGPDTGIRFPEQGAQYWDAWVTYLGSLTRTADDNQRILMPWVWGKPTLRFAPKDTTTVHATLFADGDQIVAALVDDTLEQPTGVYGNGTAPNGERFDGAAYPGVVQGPPGKYPFDDNRTFTVGTTDADTDSDFGISALRIKLVWDGLLDSNADAGAAGVFTAAVGRAVKLLKIAAGLTADAVMTPAAWKALWNTNAVGFHLEGARILPLAESLSVKSFITTPGGTIIGRNPDRVWGAQKVDVEKDYGSGITEDLARQHARTLIRSGSSHQWTGTITLNQVHAFAGDVADADIPGLTVDNLMPARDIRPGMNVKLPHFEGGKVLHVAQVMVTPGDAGDTVELMVDTGAGDVFDVSQAIARNKETRRSPYRASLAANRGWKPAGNLTTRDRFFGRVYQDQSVRGGRWNDFPIIMGQQGTVGYTDIQLANLATEYCIVVTTNRISPAKMARLIGNPFHLDADGQTAFETSAAFKKLIASKVLLYLAGAGEQPAGFGWEKGYTRNAAGTLVRTKNPLTGEHVDGSSWSYFTNPVTAPLAYALLFPKRSSTVKRGRLFWALEDDVT